MATGYRRDRSRSPMIKINNDSMKDMQIHQSQGMGQMNPMMMNNMYQQGMQGNMMMGGMYPNMMMQGMMGSGIMQPNMEMMNNSSNMEMMPQPPIPPLPHMEMNMPNTNMNMPNSNMNMPNSNMIMPNSNINIPNSNMNMSNSNMNMPNSNINMTNPNINMSNPNINMPNQNINMPNSNMNQSATPMDMNMMGGMMMDPSIMGMSNMGNIGMYPISGNDMAIVHEKKEIILKHCRLIPPDSNRPLPPTKPKPLGCRTIFVGGLPEKIRESVVREIFEQYGRIYSLRLSKKNFCHIRYDLESSVDEAIVLSGYQIKLTDAKDIEEDTVANSGWIHVDYALSRDDQNEYERRQRKALRLQHQQMEDLTNHNPVEFGRPGRGRSPSPTKVLPYTNLIIGQIMEKIKAEDTFASTLPTLVAWLERGECSKKNATSFYSMIQATNSHIRRLFGEKMQAEEELQEFKEQIKTRISNVIAQLEQVGKVFAAAAHKRVWDHFTKPQRKNIETWQKMAQEFPALKEEFAEKFEAEESDHPAYSHKPLYDCSGNDDSQQLKRENESLQFQLEAYKNEVAVIKTEAKSELEKFKAQFIARQALQGNVASKPIDAPPPPPPVEVGEARLIAVMAAFLQVHPRGASLDYLVSYVRTVLPTVTQASVHSTLQKHTDTFEVQTNGVGPEIELKWHFIAFKSLLQNNGGVTN